MLKRLPLLCAALLALAACSHSGSNGNAAPPPAPTPASTAPAAPPPAAASAATPAPTGTAAAQPASNGGAPAAPAPSASAATPQGAAEPFVDNGKWVEGKNYFLIQPAQPTDQPGKIVVTEVFSYACPACNAFHPIMDQLVKELPAGTVVTYLAASFRPDENWPLFQRAYYAAKALGVADKTYDAMFDAVWKSGELATYDLSNPNGGLKPRSAWPTLNDVAKFYAKYGVDPQQFIGVANSFSVNIQMKRADDTMKAYGVDETPSIVVNGKYRLTPMSAGGAPQTIELVKWLVAKEAAGK